VRERQRETTRGRRRRSVCDSCFTNALSLLQSLPFPLFLFHTHSQHTPALLALSPSHTLPPSLFFSLPLSQHTLRVMGWLRLVGSLKLQASFAKEPYQKDDILQKRPILLRSLLIVATSYLYALRDLLLLVCAVARVCVIVCACACANPTIEPATTRAKRMFDMMLPPPPCSPSF